MTHLDHASVLAEIAAEVANIADYPVDIITAETRIYHDARITGDDYWDFLDWFSRRFGVRLDGLDLYDLSPPEMGWWPWHRSRSQFIELRLRDLVVLAEAGLWAATGFTQNLPRTPA